VVVHHRFRSLGVLLGGGFMDIIPKQIDKFHKAGTAFMGGNFFLVAFLLFINIHHFFIDNAFWRRHNAEVQRYLFRA
jgi:UDP-N-acetylmuramyl pentapeptide phosphotransferase/UDP-N-acetylglucosamine-1-phosphate transferase